MILSVFAIAAVAALLVTPAVVRVVTAHGVYGHVRPGADPAAPRVPRLGGIAVCLATTAALGAAVLMPDRAAGASENAFLAGTLLAGWLIFAAGLLDDLYDLSPVTKLLAQCLAALVAYGVGFRIEQVSFGGISVQVGVLSLLLTVLWIVGVVNAFNLIDGLDGLATGIGLVALGSTFVVAWMLGNTEVALVCAALGGALLGFLRYNFRPARIFLGDSGSQFVGFMVAVLSVHGSTKSATAVLAAVPLLILALPLLDTLLSILRRWLRGKPVFGADERHLHHRLLAVGLTHVRAVVLLYVLAAGMAVLGVVLAFGPARMVTVSALAGAGVSVALLLFAIKRLGYHEFVEAGSVVTSGMRRVRQSIRDQIHARDVAQVLARAESMVHLQAILHDNAGALGLLYATVCRESSPEGRRAELPADVAARAWKLDWPVDAGSADPCVLRLWADAPDDLGMLTADRTARILATAVREWMAGPPPAPPRPRPDGHRPPHVVPSPSGASAAA
ncbi:MAG: undecaprenyl/decaprenyl-phosphate alpha-N-acetylglucosaminyl 1-phosphate transferase [Gemmatimonadetes bacterium]|nr:undecaprenyl/decaprenyl-phosphate alpha-N-acetylglucosaminyl 1-phosphate transferase [Gemmatimonadota bacterium]